MKKSNIVFLIFIIMGSVVSGENESGVNAQGAFLYNHGFVNPGDMGLTFTNDGIRDVTVSVGQLSGVDPETGSIITNAGNLVSLKAESVVSINDIIAGGIFIGDASGLSNLNTIALSGIIDASNLPVSGVWDASGLTILNPVIGGNAFFSGEALTILSNLIVQGAINGNIIDLSGTASSGTEGSIQINHDGKLSGNDEFFINQDTGSFSFTSEDNFFRIFRHETEDSDMICVLRTRGETIEMCMFENGVEKIRLCGDGSIYASGTLNAGGISIGGVQSTDRVNWFIPEQGDLSMGTFTKE